MRRFVASALVLVALAVAVAAWLGHRELRSPGLAGATVEIPRGQSFEATALALERAGVVRRAWTLRGLARWRDSDRRIGAGRYRFDPGLIPIEVLERLERGDVVMVRRTLAEGLSAGEVAARLFPDDSVERERFLELVRDPAPAGVDPPPTGDLEGLLFPDTYTLIDPPSAEGALRAILANGAAQTDSLRPIASASGFTWHQVLTLASVVEGEARVDEERARIAGVYLNRLELGMLLQADPTVAYATGKIGERLLYADLRIDSPYNTYLYPGLPPGPINNPGLASIRAVLRPEAHEFLYFVHEGEGRHVFSRTLSEHQAAVREARRRR